MPSRAVAVQEPSRDSDCYMEAIRTLIVDDEEPARSRIKSLLQKESDVLVIGESTTADDALRDLQALQPDLLFLDIQIRDATGFSVLERTDLDRLPVVIFVTAYDQYALRAFEASALDYLLKPFSDERFRLALDRARARLREHQISTSTDRLLSLLSDVRQVQDAVSLVPQAANYPARLVLKCGSHLIFVDADDVDLIEAEGVYVRLHVGKKVHLLRESLSNVEQRLDPEKFIRIHRSTIVNSDRVREIVPHFNGGHLVILNDGRQLKMSRGYRDRVSATLG